MRQFEFDDCATSKSIWRASENYVHRGDDKPVILSITRFQCWKRG
eukprot:CAMPEP_0182449932 /NCGR_PEP_ID=MMETSP1172-20130603/37700_1 /TAXON_ID=708627 /ORGANISM="Timspurckia oligopyrenoides, Strain CCMP3278" /LENGTH=44 /DNA_ID= /DNA_START= /DNA_END= /DNA_ORIENTATION=